MFPVNHMDRPGNRTVAAVGHKSGQAKTVSGHESVDHSTAERLAPQFCGVNLLAASQRSEPMSETEARAFAVKFERFEQSLTGKERRLFADVLSMAEGTLPTAAADDDLSWWAG